MSIEKRNISIDRAKGILILLVVLGHILIAANPKYDILAYRLVSTFIYSFHMSAFFVLSGCTYKVDKWIAKGFISFVNSRIKSLIIPYLLFESIGALYQVYIAKQISLLKAVNNILFVQCNVGADWFLIALLFAGCLFWIVIACSKKKVYVGWIMAFIALLSPYYLPDSVLTQSIIRGGMGLFFMWTGAQLKKIFVRDIKWKEGLLYSAIVIVGSVAEVKLGGGDYYYCSIENPILFVLIGIFGSVCVAFWAQKIKLPLLEFFGKRQINCV